MGRPPSLTPPSTPNAERGRAYYRHNRAKVLKRTRQYYLEHKDEYTKWRADWYSKHPDFSRNDNQRTKLRALQIVAKRPDPKCVYCGCDDVRFLEVNHKEGGGAKEAIMSGNNFYWAIIKGRRNTDDLEIACRPDNALHYLKLKYGKSADQFEILWKPILSSV